MEDIKVSRVRISSVKKLEWSRLEGRVWMTLNGTEYSGDIMSTEGSMYPLKPGFSFIRDETNGYSDTRIKFVVVADNEI